MFKETLITTFFFIFLFSFSAYSLGIGPSGQISMPDVNFQPNLRIERDIFVKNSEYSYFPVEMEIGGDLAEYGELSEYEFMLAPKGEPGDGRSLKFTMTLPEEFEPGSHIVAIRATQVLEGEFEGGGTAVGAKVRVAVGFYVHVPYPGKYLETDMEIENAEVNETIVFIISAINRGNETIENAQGTIQIYDSNGNLVVSLKTDKKSIEPGEPVELRAEWLAFNINPGEYGAVVLIDYDGFTTTIHKDFRIGSPTAKILGVTAEPIANGTVGTIKTTVMSYWNSEIKDAYVIITAKKGGYSGVSQSPSLTLKPWEEIEITNYWDTSEALGPGEYQGIATLYYLNKTDIKEFTLEVTERQFVLPDLMWIVVVILIIIFAVLILFTLRKRRKRFKQIKLA